MIKDKSTQFTIAHLVKPAPPWILRLVSDRLDPMQTELTLGEYGITARVLNGTRTRTASALFSEFASRLDFPDYFGHNWSALNDCLVDLTWLPGLAYAVVIRQSCYLLKNEPESKIMLFSRLISDVAAKWAAPICLGEDWDRSEVPFHLVLHEEPGHIPALKARLQQAGIDLPILSLDLNTDPVT